MTQIRSSLGLLIERLHWPVPRVRWEAARQLAQLIRQGDDEVRLALLAWCAGQRLESDVAILPSLIHAFKLEHHFEFAELHQAIKAPSVLSDALLRALYSTDASKLFSFRLGYTQDADLKAHDALFEEGIGTLVPPVFRSVLASEEARTGLPFLAQWRGEWLELHKRYREAYTRHPSYFFAGDRGSTGSLDVRQRAVYVSAFLRTLAWAELELGMPRTYAEDLAEFAVPFDRGLADFEGSEAPAWSKNFLERFESMGEVDFARTTWRDAAEMVTAGFEPLALTMTDQSELLSVSVQVYRVVNGTQDEGQPANLADLKWISTRGEPWSMEGRLPLSDGRKDNPGLVPLVVAAMPSALGRAHIDLLLGKLLLADPVLATGQAKLACAADRLRLSDDHGLISELFLWYANWTPTHPPDVIPIGSLTTCRSDALRSFRKSRNVKVRRMVRVQIARRKHSYEPFELSTKEFCISNYVFVQV